MAGTAARIKRVQTFAGNRWTIAIAFRSLLQLGHAIHRDYAGLSMMLT